MTRLNRIINRIRKGPFCAVTYCYKLNPQIFSNRYINIEFCGYEILQNQNCNQVLEIREDNIKNTFEKICTNQIVLIARYNGMIAGHAVLKKPENSFAGRHWNKKALIHYCYVSPQFRGRNIYPYMITNLANIAFTKYKISEIYIFADKNNLASQNGINKVGCIYDETGYEFSWGGVSIVKYWQKDNRSPQVT